MDSWPGEVPGEVLCDLGQSAIRKLSHTDGSCGVASGKFNLLSLTVKYPGK